MGEERIKSPEELRVLSSMWGRQKRALKSRCWPGAAGVREARWSSLSFGSQCFSSGGGHAWGGVRQLECPVTPASLRCSGT